MTKQVSLHVIAHDCTALAALLQERLGSNVRVRRYVAVPPHHAISSGAVMVVYLDSPHTNVDPRRLLPFLDGHDIWLAYGNGKISAEWLDAVRWPNVRFVHCDAMDCEVGVRPLADALVKRVSGPGADEILALVLAKEPSLGGLESLVRALCENPWRVRHPVQLAAAAGNSLLHVRRTLRQRGFHRVEHFITYVRWVIYEQLVVIRRLHSAVAEHLAGITDRSNWHRQLLRARGGSPRGLRGLKSVVGSLAFLGVLLSDLACRDKTGNQVASAETVRRDAGDSAVALPVVGAIVRRGDLILTIRTTGQVRAERQVSLKGETQGTVIAVLVRPGDRVDSGQALVRLDPRPFDLAVREAESQLGEALGRYRDVLLGEDTTDAAPVAVERRRAARLRTGVDGAEARLEGAKLDRERATLRAPFAGTADQVQAVVGQRLAAGEPIATIVDLSSLTVEAAVLEHDLPLVRRGATATVSLAAGGGTLYAGRVLAVLPLVDTTTRAGRAVVRVRTGDGVLRPGMYADVELEATRLPDRVVVPALAIIERDGRPLVFRYHGGKAEWVYVASGRSNGRETEIVADSATGRPAVAAGDTVLVAGHLTLTHDAPVRLIARGEIRPG